MQIVLTGSAELNQALARLTSKRQKDAIRRASREALKPLARAAKRTAPKETGALRRSIVVRALRRSRTRIGARITTRQGLFRGDEFYGGFQEFGWKTGKRGSSNRRQVPGTHFIKRTTDAYEGQVLREYRRLVRLEIVRGARVTAGKANRTLTELGLS